MTAKPIWYLTVNQMFWNAWQTCMQKKN